MLTFRILVFDCAGRVRWQIQFKDFVTNRIMDASARFPTPQQRQYMEFRPPLTADFDMGFSDESGAAPPAGTPANSPETPSPNYPQMDAEETGAVELNDLILSPQDLMAGFEKRVRAGMCRQENPIQVEEANWLLVAAKRIMDSPLSADERSQGLNARETLFFHRMSLLDSRFHLELIGYLSRFVDFLLSPEAYAYVEARVAQCPALSESSSNVAIQRANWVEVFQEEFPPANITQKLGLMIALQYDVTFPEYRVSVITHIP